MSHGGALLQLVSNTGGGMNQYLTGMPTVEYSSAKDCTDFRKHCLSSPNESEKQRCFNFLHMCGDVDRQMDAWGNPIGTNIKG